MSIVWVMHPVRLDTEKAAFINRPAMNYSQSLYTDKQLGLNSILGNSEQIEEDITQTQIEREPATTQESRPWPALFFSLFFPCSHLIFSHLYFFLFGFFCCLWVFFSLPPEIYCMLCAISSSSSISTVHARLPGAKLKI